MFAVVVFSGLGFNHVQLIVKDNKSSFQSYRVLYAASFHLSGYKMHQTAEVFAKVPCCFVDERTDKVPQLVNPNSLRLVLIG